MNFCINCTHHRHVVQNELAPQVWYNHFCAAAAFARILTADPVTGKPCFMAKNDLGGTYTTDKSMPNCRDRNIDGHCKQFERKGFEQ